MQILHLQAIIRKGHRLILLGVEIQTTLGKLGKSASFCFAITSSQLGERSMALFAHVILWGPNWKYNIVKKRKVYAFILICDLVLRVKV